MMWPLQPWIELISTENNVGLKVGISTELPKEKGKSKFETFRCGSHGLTFQPDDYKLGKRWTWTMVWGQETGDSI